MENIDIRHATEDDLDQLAEMRWQARVEGGERHPTLSIEEFKEECIQIMHEWISDGSHSFWILLIHNIIVAHIPVHRVDLLPRPIPHSS